MRKFKSSLTIPKSDNDCVGEKTLDCVLVLLTLALFVQMCVRMSC